MGQKFKTQNVTKLKNFKCDKTQKLKSLHNSNVTKLKKKLKVTKQKKNLFVTNPIRLNCE